jgi:two-component system chemotaxis response regulator CheY
MPDYSKLEVLVIDDMSSMRLMIKAVLRDMGVESIAQAGDGEKALEVLAGRKFGLVICDWDMPKKTGIEVLQALRGGDRQPDLPFIMLTANSDRQHVMQAIQSGVSDYLAKPFQPQALVEKIERVLG